MSTEPAAAHNFYANGALVSSVKAPPYETYWTAAGSDGSLTLSAVAVGALGSSSSASVTLTMKGDALTIDSPSAGAYPSSLVLVQGSFTAPTQNCSVTVNDIPADLDGSHFALNNVRVGSTSTPIVVKLIASDGSEIARKSVAVSGAALPAIMITTSSASGPAPLQIDFGANSASGAPISNLQYTHSGGQPLAEAAPGALASILFDTPGVYQATVTATDSNGTIASQNFVISVQDPLSTDQILQSVWTSFAQAIAAGDNATALKFMSYSAQQKFGPVFAALGGALPGIVATFSIPQAISIGDEVAEYALVRPVSGTKKLFFLEFLRLQNGIWVIDEM